MEIIVFAYILFGKKGSFYSTFPRVFREIFPLAFLYLQEGKTKIKNSVEEKDTNEKTNFS